ncbi:thioredoxin family protein [Priestia megaterium]
MVIRKNKFVFLIFILIIVVGLLSIMGFQYQKHSDLYGNQVSLKTTQNEIKSSSSLYVYYYQTDCVHCKKVSPYLIPLGEKQDDKFIYIDIQKYTKAWSNLHITATPTLVHYVNGSEVDRIEGEYPENIYKEFFNKN